MPTIDQIHRANLALLVAEAGGVGLLAAKIGKDPSQVSQWLNASPDSKTGKPRGMRPASCREIELLMGKPAGWMDTNHTDPEQERIHSRIVDEAVAEERRVLAFGRRTADIVHSANGEHIEIPQFSGVGGSMGDGVILRDQPGEIQAWNVTPEWVNKNIKNHTGIANLCIVTGFGNSMQPLYNPGDPLIVDRGIKTVDADATYFFRVGNEGFIKILQRIPGEGIRVISKNKDYETWTIKPDMDFEVFGQVLKAWCGTEL